MKKAAKGKVKKKGKKAIFGPNGLTVLETLQKFCKM